MALQGGKELKAQFKAIRSGNRNASRTAAMAAARHLRTAERQAVPRATGAGARTIIAKREREREGEAVATVAVTRAGFYLRILESGARPHRIGVKSSHAIVDKDTRKIIAKGRGRRALALGKGFGAGLGLIVFRRAVQHPGVRPRPWFVPTYEREKLNMVEVVRRSYAAGLEKQAAKKGL